MTTQRGGAYKLYMNRRSFIKLAATASAAALATACGINASNSGGKEGETQPIDTLPAPTFGVDMYKLYPENNNIEAKILSNVEIVEELSTKETEKHDNGMRYALEKEGVDLGDPRIKVLKVGMRLTDDQGHEITNYFLYVTKAPDVTGLEDSEEELAGIYAYVGVDDQKLKFVPADESPNLNRGRIFPVVASKSGKLVHLGLGKEEQPGKYLITVPLWDLNIEDKTVRFRDMFSGATVEIDQDGAPEKIKKVLFAHTPVEQVPAETQVAPEFIPLKTVDTEFKETLDGVTTKIVLRMDSSMEMKARKEKTDEFVESDNFPGGSNSAMNEYARRFIYETAILTNQNAAGMSQKEFLTSLAIAQMNPDDDSLWNQVEISIYNDATKKKEQVRFLPSTKLDLVFAYSNKIDGCTSTWDDGWNEGLRTEINGDVVRIVRSIDNYGYDATAFRPFVHHMSALPNLLAKYNGQKIKNFNVGANHSKALIRAINVYNTYVCAFKVFFKGKPASDTEAQQNP